MRSDVTDRPRTAVRRKRPPARSHRLRGALIVLLVAVLIAGGLLIRSHFATAPKPSLAAAVITFPPSAPTLLTASHISAKSVALTWSASTGKPGVRDYRVLRDGTAIGTVVLTTFTDVTVSARTGYRYQVEAEGMTGRRSAPTAALQVTTLRARAATPTGLTAKPLSSTKVLLTWLPAATGNLLVRYSVYRDGQRIGSTKASKFWDGGVTAGGTYSYTVAVRDATDRISSQSTATKVTTPAASSAAPQTPPPGPASGQPSPGGFPGADNTGYKNAPGYPGQLKDCSKTVIQSNSTYQYCDFPDGLYVGSAGSHPSNITFIGCRFASNAVDDANVADYGDGIVFSYDTFEPSAVSADSEPSSPYAAAVANGDGYQYGIDKRYAGALTVDHSDIWGFAEAIQFGDSSQAKPLVVTNTWIHNPRNDGGVDHTDGILENYGGLSYMVFDHNTIVGDGNTNALALQGGTPYSHVTITNNYFSGYGYMVNSGSDTNSTDMVFTGNVWGTDFEPTFGPLYGNSMYTTPGLGGVWANNTIYVAPGTTWMSARNSGMFWWPTTGTPSSSSDMVGHKTDYPGP
jgi:chitodextrinase